MKVKIKQIRSSLALLLGAAALVLAPPAVAQPTSGTTLPGQWVQGTCNGHGQENFNRCFCDPGWTGSECEAPETPPDCGEHGKVSGYRCRCDAGWKGRTCQTAPLVCTHGKPEHGKCACDPGWSGGACDKGA